MAATGVGTDFAKAISGADGFGIATVGFVDIGGVAAVGGAGDVDVCATAAAVAEGDGFGVAFWFFANLAPFGVGVAFAPGFPCFGATCTIAGVSTGFAASTRSN